MSYRQNATMTTKGQVTVPAEIRQRLGVKAGDRLTFDLSDTGRLTIIPMKRKSIFEDFNEVKLPPLGRALTREDIKEAARAAMAKKFGDRSKSRR